MRWPWRRAETLNEQLMREAGLGQAASTPDEAPRESHPRLRGLVEAAEEILVSVEPPGRFATWNEHSALAGVARTREWDITAVADAPQLEGDEVRFDVLPDGSILVEDEVGDAALAPLADAVEATLPPPYRVQAVRQTDVRWAIAAEAIRVVELPEQPGDALEITEQAGVRELRIDGKRSFGSVPKLELLAAAQFADYAIQAQRLDGDLWEVRIDPL